MSTALSSLLVLVGALLQQQPAPADPVQSALARLDVATTEQEVRDAERSLAHVPASKRYQASSKIAEAWWKLRRPKEVVRVWESARDRVASEDSAWLALSLGAAYERADRRDDAIKTLEPLAMRADGKEPESAHVNVDHAAARLLADVLERAGRFREALVYHEKWRPNAGCGTCRAGDSDAREVAIGRCKMGLGDWDGAVAVWNRLLLEDDGLSRATDLAVGLLIEHGARRERLIEVKRLSAKWDDVAQRMWNRLLPVGEAFAAKDAARFVELVTAAHEVPWPERHMAERMLRDLGKPATDALIARIARREAEAATVAALAKVAEALPTIRLRLETEKDAKVREVLQWSADTLRATR